MAARLTSVANKVPGLIKAGTDFATPRLQTFWKYAKVELKPPGPSEIPLVADGFSNMLKSARTGAWKKLSVQEAFINTLVGIEIGCWFFVGEVIGKKHLIGYQIPGTFKFGVEL